ncbi:MED14-domain-containing protein [Mytilinidion resinicola]|uniref:Mediator of RNA polymerase II transcription subunit 14 n=1 Tax=Mytilinidion resinicola TaxID=574789 RepID=A0A6A6Y4Z6_9PEZI|nr:MED14-domain-containing protein [Mytilinidion resinicola]KAF2803862.1 MED14-domain-containing protein [Mytilinidion resinicola]
MRSPGHTKPATNGDRAIAPPERGGAFSINGGKQIVAGQVDIPASLLDLPPEIIHITNSDAYGQDVYSKVSTLLSRVVQECFLGLQELIPKMADLPVAQQPGLTNGLGNHAVNGPGNGNMHPNNIQKKILMMEFAEYHRTRFVKLLVLSAWSRRAEQVQRLIDVSSWLRDQALSYNAVVDAMGNMKREMEHATLKSPDINTALKVLATGKASWMPDMDYIPPEPLSPQEILKLWRDGNVRCALRLNIHEELPRHLKQWKIGSGRVTFTVPGEFELDVATSTEDSSGPWWFVDLRFLFSPAPEIPDSFFRATLETQANAVLSASGLSGCFDFLHNLVLTHKIAILKAQAYQLTAGNWAGSIKVEPVRRSLVVQYWTELPGKKSWIEIGIVSGKPKNGKICWKGPTPPQLSVRWFRQGLEVKESEISFDWDSLSMENMLRRVIAHHIGYMLETIRDRLVAAARGGSTLKTEVSTSDTEPSDCMLEVNLGTSATSTTVLVDPVTGRFAMQPCTAISASIEQKASATPDPISFISNTIPQILCASLQTAVDKQAQLLGWAKPFMNIRTDSIKEAIKQDVVQHTLFRARGWTQNWVLAGVFNLSGVSWWAIDTEPSYPGVKIKTAERIQSDSSTAINDLALRDVMTTIQRKAVAEITLSATTSSLVQRQVPYKVSSPLESRTAAQKLVDVSSLWISADEFLKSDQQDAEPWARNVMRIKYESFDSAKSTVLFSVSGEMAKGFEHETATIVRTSNSSDIKFVGENNSNFRIFISVPFGTSLDNPLSTRLREITHLLNFISILRKRKFQADRITPNRITFRYGSGGACTATVSFAPDAPIKLTLPRNNPHNRIRAYLAAGLNAQRHDAARFRAAVNLFTYHLLATLPLLSALDSLHTTSDAELEGTGTGSGGKETAGQRVTQPAIHARAPDAFRLVYTNPRVSFDANLRVQHDRHVWHVQDASAANPDQRAKPAPKSEALRKALEKLWRENEAGGLEEGAGEEGAEGGWQGLRTGIVASIEGVAKAVVRLDGVVRGCATKGGGAEEVPVVEEVVRGNANVSKGAPQPVVGLGISNANANAVKPQAAAAAATGRAKLELQKDAAAKALLAHNQNQNQNREQKQAPRKNGGQGGGPGVNGNNRQNQGRNGNNRGGGGGGGGGPDIITID